MSLEEKSAEVTRNFRQKKIVLSSDTLNIETGVEVNKLLNA